LYGSLGGEGGDELAGVGLHGKIDVHVELVDFVGVDVDHRFFRGAGKAARVVGGDDVVQATADADQQVAVLHGEIAAAQRDDAGPAGVQRMFPGQQVERVPGGRHRYLQMFG